MPSDKEKESWTIDQITKSEFLSSRTHSSPPIGVLAPRQL